MEEKIGIVAFAFGAPWHIRSNQYIAYFSSEKAREFNASVYTQLDVCVQSDIEVMRTEEEPGNPPPILRIARGAIQWAKQREINTLIIVAAKPQSWRALRDTKRAVREAGLQIKVRLCEQIRMYLKDFWFCPESTQKRTRSQREWNKREIILKLMPFWLYKLIAS